MKENIVINTYNESDLHQTLKTMYKIQNNGTTEVQGEKYIYDVVAEDGTIIEIQTKNLSSLMIKISTLLNEGKKIKLVHPVIITKKIVTNDKEGNILSSRTSPKKGSIYDIFKELTGIYPILLHENFQLEILEISILETRLKSDEKIQSKNNRRRFKKDWIKTNKKLNEIYTIKSFKTKKDYLDLLPDNLPKEFSSKDIKLLLQKQQNLNKNVYNHANLILWLYSRMNLIKFIKKENRLFYYSIVS